MNACDKCNRYTCADCPHTEPEKTFAEQFEDKLALSPDSAIEWLADQDIDCIIMELIEIYWRQNKVYALREIKRRINNGRIYISN